MGHAAKVRNDTVVDRNQRRLEGLRSLHESLDHQDDEGEGDFARWVAAHGPDGDNQISREREAIALRKLFESSH